MKFVLNNDISPLSFRGCEKVFQPHRATILEDTELEMLKGGSVMFRDYLDKGKLVVSDEMRTEWLPIEEQLTEANRMNIKLVAENKELGDKVAHLDKEVKRLMRQLKEQTESLAKKD